MIGATRATRGLFALFLGPAGLGVVSQITSVVQTLAVGSNLGLGIAVTKSIASARGREDAAAARLAAWTGFLTVVSAAALAASALMLGRSDRERPRRRGRAA